MKSWPGRSALGEGGRYNLQLVFVPPESPPPTRHAEGYNERKIYGPKPSITTIRILGSSGPKINLQAQFRHIITYYSDRLEAYTRVLYASGSSGAVGIATDSGPGVGSALRTTGPDSSQRQSNTQQVGPNRIRLPTTPLTYGPAH